MNHKVQYSLIHHGSISLSDLEELAVYGLEVVDCIINAVVKLSVGIRNLINKFAIVLIIRGVFLPIVSQQFISVIVSNVKYFFSTVKFKSLAGMFIGIPITMFFYFVLWSNHEFKLCEI